MAVSAAVAGVAMRTSAPTAPTAPAARNERADRAHEGVPFERAELPVTPPSGPPRDPDASALNYSARAGWAVTSDATGTPRAGRATPGPGTRSAGRCPTARPARSGRPEGDRPRRRPERWPRRRSCSTRAARSTPTRCSRTPGSPRPEDERQLWRGLAQLAVGLTHAAARATRAARRRCSSAGRATSRPTPRRRRTASTSPGWPPGRAALAADAAAGRELDVRPPRLRA